PTGSSLTFFPDVAGNYVVSVTARDWLGQASAPMQVSISTAACGPTLSGISGTAPGSGGPVVPTVIGKTITMPLASAISDTGVTNEVNIGSLVSLTIPAVSDNNASCNTTAGSPGSVVPYTYRWSLISLPAGSHASLSASTTTGDPGASPVNLGTTTFSPDLQH